MAYRARSYLPSFVDLGSSHFLIVCASNSLSKINTSIWPFNLLLRQIISTNFSTKILDLNIENSCSYYLWIWPVKPSYG